MRRAERRRGWADPCRQWRLRNRPLARGGTKSYPGLGPARQLQVERAQARVAMVSPFGAARSSGMGQGGGCVRGGREARDQNVRGGI